MNTLVKVGLGALVAYLLLKPKKAEAAPAAVITPDGRLVPSSAVVATAQTGVMDTHVEPNPSASLAPITTITPTGPVATTSAGVLPGLVSVTPTATASAGVLPGKFNGFLH